MDTWSDFNEILDVLLTSFKKAREYDISTTDIIILLGIGVVAFIFIHGFRTGYLTCVAVGVVAVSILYISVFSTASEQVPLALRPKRQQKLDVGNILEQICKEATPSISDSYNNIRSIILGKEIDENKLLHESIDDLLKNLEFEDEAEIKDFLHMRVAFRWKIFQMREPIIVEQTNVMSFNWDKVSQLLEENVEPSSKLQRQSWYTYIEKEGITGSLLLEEIDDIIKNLGLNKGQRKKFYEMMKKIRGENNQGQTTKTITVVDHATVGVIAGDGANINDINVNAHNNHGSKQRMNKNPGRKSKMLEDAATTS